jgi:hypothetical protein
VNPCPLPSRHRKSIATRLLDIGAAFLALIAGIGVGAVMGFPPLASNFAVFLIVFGLVIGMHEQLLKGSTSFGPFLFGVVITLFVPEDTLVSLPSVLAHLAGIHG